MTIIISQISYIHEDMAKMGNIFHRKLQQMINFDWMYRDVMVHKRE